MRLSVQIIRNNEHQRVSTVIFTVDSKGCRRYFFNLPETYQRFDSENNSKREKESKYFFTDLSPDNLNGFLGYSNTIYESKASIGSIVFGPPGTTSFIEKIKDTLGYKFLPFGCMDLPWSSESRKLLGVRSEALIEKIKTSPNFTQIFFNSNEYLLKESKPEDRNDPEKYINNGDYVDERITIKPFAFKKHVSGEEKNLASKIVISYLLTLPIQPGKIIKERLEALPFNKQSRTTFINTGSFEFEGKVYYVKDIRDEDIPSCCALLIDCPDLSVLEQLLQEKGLNFLYKGNINRKETSLEAIIHLGPKHVITHKLYFEFMSRFPNECQHIITSPEFKERLCDSKMYELQLKDYSTVRYVNYLESSFKGFFKKIERRMTRTFYTNEENDNKTLTDIAIAFPSEFKVTLPKFLYEFVLTPLKNQGFNLLEKKQGKENKDELDQDFLKEREFLEQVLAKHKPKAFGFDNPIITCLGTCSMVPSKLRNVSAILIQFEAFNVILDCGEGTFDQMYSHFGAIKYKEELLKVAIIFISHIHGDHHIGLSQFLVEYERLLEKDARSVDKKLFVVLPFNLGLFYHNFSKSICSFPNVNFVYSQDISDLQSPLKVFEKADLAYNMSKPQCSIGNPENSDPKHEEDEVFNPHQNEYLNTSIDQRKANRDLFGNFVKTLGIHSFLPVQVDHCPHAHGLILSMASFKFKLVFSGDTRPCDNLIKEGKDCTVLIHEATFWEDLNKNAFDFKHSTVHEAASVAMKMNAWKLILFHFSSRYAKIGYDFRQNLKLKVEDPDLWNYILNNMVVGFDHLNSTVSDLEILPHVTRALCYMLNSND